MTPTWQSSSVLTKKDFVARYAHGEFGNASPTWRTLDEFWNYCDSFPNGSPIPGLYSLRSKTASATTHYKLTGPEALAKWVYSKNPDQWYASEMAPDHKNLIQGEVQQTHEGSGRCGLDLHYSTLVGKPMKEALIERGEYASGIMASFLLKQNLCPNSYDWLMELLSRYPHHVVEFSTFSCKWGTLYPLYNTVFWEIRKY